MQIDFGYNAITMDTSADALETDPRFPTGPWAGYFVQKLPNVGRKAMELRLTFRAGVMQGDGRDWVGLFTIQGRYQLEDGRCEWIKQYVGRHAVAYRGFNEGRGIWGIWTIESAGLRGGFHIWPEGMPDPSASTLREAADLPVESVEFEPLAAPVGEARNPHCCCC